MDPIGGLERGEAVDTASERRRHQDRLIRPGPARFERANPGRRRTSPRLDTNRNLGSFYQHANNYKTQTLIVVLDNIVWSQDVLEVHTVIAWLENDGNWWAREDHGEPYARDSFVAARPTTALTDENFARRGRQLNSVR